MLETLSREEKIMSNWKRTLEKKIEVYAKIGKDANWAKVRYIRELANKLALREYVGFKGLVDAIDKAVEFNVIDKVFADLTYQTFLEHCQTNDIQIELEGEDDE